MLMCRAKFSQTILKVQEIRPFSLFHNLDLDIASTDGKYHFANPWARSCQYQCVCKTLSKYSNRFKSYGHFSQTDRGQTDRGHVSQTDRVQTTSHDIDWGLTHRAIIGHTPKVNVQLLCWSTFSGSCNVDDQRFDLEHCEPNQRCSFLS